MKIVLEIRGNTPPKTNDMLVYDEANDCWKICPKKEVFKDVFDKIKELEKTCKNTQKKCQETQDDVKQIAKIVKENV